MTATMSDTLIATYCTRPAPHVCGHNGPCNGLPVLTVTASVAVDPRPEWDEYFMRIASAVADRADCTRRTASAVVVKNNRIVSTGYNGAPAGNPGCLSAGACPRGQLTTEELASYTSYDSGPGFCIAVHAEANALLYASREQTEGATMYTWANLPKTEPCVGCWRLIAGAGITRCVWLENGWYVEADPLLACQRR